MLIPKESSDEVMTNNWHWLNKHPVEFSKNKHTPDICPTLGTASGQLLNYYPVELRRVNPQFPEIFQEFKDRWLAVPGMLGSPAADNLPGSLPALATLPGRIRVRKPRTAQMSHRILNRTSATLS